uniref:BPTI/Kunitz inhibitor domain-containing protein n=1 Tax=Angiostrongylus cantonensis TaxID=6313 RepID=A0A0K0DNR3_ANGCA
MRQEEMEGSLAPTRVTRLLNRTTVDIGSLVISQSSQCVVLLVLMMRYFRKCQAFQYYGCNGNGNNFPSLKSCHDHFCNGPAVLVDPNQQPQRCSDTVPCPSGYACNPEHYCCPFSETACSASLSKGDVCGGVPLRTMWYYDQKQAKCIEFSYNGCGGTANRFTSRKACTSACVNSSLSGSCPRGMSPVIEDGDTTVKECTLNVMGTCPFSASCVRSTTNQPICCQAVTSCPNNRIPYVIPESTSVVACNIETDECPVCYPFFLNSFRTLGCFKLAMFHSIAIVPDLHSFKAFNQIHSAYYLMFSISPCPAQLTTNGQTCTVNAIGDCPRNYLCFRDAGFKHGSCCRTGPPRCAIKQYVPVFVSGTQVQICQADLGGCPQNSRCITSNIPKVSICCHLHGSSSEFRSGSSNVSGIFERNFYVVNGDRPFAREGIVFGCSFIRDDCPAGYKCEFSSTGQAVCCSDSESIRCPVGSSAFEYGGRPLACPAGSTNVCEERHLLIQVILGVRVYHPLNRRQFCSPLRDSCPIGYHCMESDQAGQYICCAQGDLSEQFKGFCPPNQIPYVSREGFPPTCHMQLNPCPTMAPYICIYSAMKQDSYCCAPIDSSSPNIPNSSMAASPMKRISKLPPEITSASASHPYAGMSQTFPGGQLLPPIGSIGIPDRIPGVNLEKVTYFHSMPPAAASAIASQIVDNVYGAGSSTGSVLSGCPIGSMPLVRADHTVVTCAEQSCPIGFMCLFAEKDNRFQCCSLSSTNTAITKSDSSTQITPIEIPTGLQQLVCPQGFFLIDGKCLKVLFAGQKGCFSDEHCVAREPNATCDNGYCVCPVTKPLVHDGKCVFGCPEGFANIAGRCYDPTTVIFMDSVDERENGTIGGYCLETLVEEKRCVVENSYCSEKTVTCQCKVGYSLNMDFDNKEDKGSCRQDDLSRFKFSELDQMPPIDDELYFVDIGQFTA